MEAGGGWCSTATMVPSLNKAPILATRRLHGPLKFGAFAQELLSFTCELIRGSADASPRGCAGLHRSALRSRHVELDGCRIYNICRLYFLCVFPGS